MEVTLSKDLDYELLKQNNKDKIHISFSEFTKYQECGHRHLIQKYLSLVMDETSIHLIFGNSVHKAIELGIKELSDVEERVNIFKKEFYTEMHNKMSDHPDMVNFNDFMNQGENIIRYLSTEGILKKYEIIGVEYVLYEPLFGVFHFKGFIDLIVRDRKTGRYVIIDWKTSGEAWDVNKKKKDKIFMAQMRFYKYFFARKNNIPLDQIDCRYVVLNRLKNKWIPKNGYGELQRVDIYADCNDIEESLMLIGETIKNIHILNTFPKAKLNDKKENCKYCPLKDNIKYCNSQPEQYKEFLNEFQSQKRII